jgi:hypothetical protein
MFVIAAVASLVIPQAAAADEALATSSVRVLSGTGSFHSLSAPSKEVTVFAGDLVRGTVHLRTVNELPSDNATPLVAVPSWGDHNETFWTVTGSVSNGTSDHDVDVNITAPASVGTFFLAFAFDNQTSGALVASCTDQRHMVDNVSEAVWDDGNDLAQLTLEQIADMQEEGRTSVIIQTDGGYQLGHVVPGDVVIIKVIGKPGSISGCVTDVGGNRLEGVNVALHTGQSTTTDEGGKFSIGVANGTYQVTFSRDGYQDSIREIEVRSGETMNIGSVPIAAVPPPPLPFWMPVVVCVVVVAGLVALFMIRRMK